MRGVFTSKVALAQQSFSRGAWLTAFLRWGEPRLVLSVRLSFPYFYILFQESHWRTTSSRTTCRCWSTTATISATFLTARVQISWARCNSTVSFVILTRRDPWSCPQLSRLHGYCTTAQPCQNASTMGLSVLSWRKKHPRWAWTATALLFRMK